MADFAQAVKWLKASKKVRRDVWGNPACFFQMKISGVIYMGSTTPTNVVDASDRQAYFSIADFEGKDWELYHASR